MLKPAIFYYSLFKWFQRILVPWTSFSGTWIHILSMCTHDVVVNKHLSIQWHTEGLAVALISLACFLRMTIIFSGFQPVIQRHSCLPS